MVPFKTILAQPDHDAARLLHVRLAQDDRALRRALLTLHRLVDVKDEYLRSFARQLDGGRAALTERQLRVARDRVRFYCPLLVKHVRAQVANAR